MILCIVYDIEIMATKRKRPFFHVIVSKPKQYLDKLIKPDTVNIHPQEFLIL